MIRFRSAASAALAQASAVSARGRPGWRRKHASRRCARAARDLARSLTTATPLWDGSIEQASPSRARLRRAVRVRRVRVRYGSGGHVRSLRRSRRAARPG